MKKLFLGVLMLVVCSLFLIGCTPSEKEYETHELTEVAEKESRKCFNFFWGTANLDKESPSYGLIPDRFPSNGLASIASVGYGLTAFPIGVERGWIKYEAAQERALTTLLSMEKLQRVNGFYYHFYYEKNHNIAAEIGLPAKGTEVSVIDTAIFLCGALFAGEYFGGEVAEVANRIYAEVNWPWYVEPGVNQFYMGYDAETNTFSGNWDVYGEQLMVYFLAAGSPTYPIDKSVYDSFRRIEGTYGEDTFISSWFGSIFTYQFSHAWIDFARIEDADGVNWFDNSVKATYANYNYCQDYSYKYKTFAAGGWGLTACDGPDGYNGQYGSAPSGTDNTAHFTDGTVALAGAIGSIVFAPELVLDTMDYYYTALDGKLFGGYGFYDSYNIDRNYIANDVIGIDKGISLLMIENYRDGIVWKTFMELDCMEKAIDVLEFEYV